MLNTHITYDNDTIEIKKEFIILLNRLKREHNQNVKAIQISTNIYQISTYCTCSNPYSWHYDYEKPKRVRIHVIKIKDQKMFSKASNSSRGICAMISDTSVL